MLGGYSGVPKFETTLLEGIQSRAGKHVEILYSEGCRITEGGSWVEDEVVKVDPDENLKRIEEARKVSEKADLIVLAIGGNEQTSREDRKSGGEGKRAGR